MSQESGDDSVTCPLVSVSAVLFAGLTRLPDRGMNGDVTYIGQPEIYEENSINPCFLEGDELVISLKMRSW